MTNATTGILKERLNHLITGDSLKARLIRGSLGSAGIQAANRLLALILGIVLARSLGPEGYGIYAYAFAIMSLLMVLAEAGVPTLLVREVAQTVGREEWGTLRGITRRARQFVLLTATTVATTSLLALWWRVDTISPVELYTMGLMLLVLPVAALTKTVAHALRGLHRVVLGQAVNLLIRPFLVLLIVGILFLLWPELRKPQYAMAAQLFGAGTVLLVGLGLLQKHMPTEAQMATPIYQNRNWLRSAVPFTLIGGAMIINNQADTIMVGWFMNAGDIGNYRVASQCSLIVMFFLQAAQSVLAPKISDYYSKGNISGLAKLYKKSTKYVLFLTLIPAITIVIFSKQIVSIVFGNQYLESALPLTILTIGYFLNVSLGPVGTILQMTKHEAYTANTLWIIALINVALNVVMIPAYGLSGAAISTATSITLYHIILRYGVKIKLGF